MSFWCYCFKGYNKYDYWTSGNRLGTDMLIWMSTGLPFNTTFSQMKRPNPDNNGLDNGEDLKMNARPELPIARKKRYDFLSGHNIPNSRKSRGAWIWEFEEGGGGYLPWKYFTAPVSINETFKPVSSSWKCDRVKIIIILYLNFKFISLRDCFIFYGQFLHGHITTQLCSQRVKSDQSRKTKNMKLYKFKNKITKTFIWSLFAWRRLDNVGCAHILFALLYRPRNYYRFSDSSTV